VAVKLISLTHSLIPSLVDTQTKDVLRVHIKGGKAPLLLERILKAAAVNNTKPLHTVVL